MKENWLPSGRGIRYELLPLSTVDQIIGSAMKEASPDTAVVTLERQVARYGAQSMLRQVTTTKGPFKSAAKPELPEPKWENVDAMTLLDRWEAYFDQKDDALLRSLYNRHHSVTQQEIDTIMGKERDVSAG